MRHATPPSCDLALSRRDLLKVGASVATVGAVPAAGAQTTDVAPSGALPTAKVSFEVNGEARTLDVDTRTTLLDALREHLKLTGTKKTTANAVRAP
jgi:xanthine dehydrogenase YagT iron-sulfur-binding subunit